MFSRFLNRSKFCNPILSEICKKYTNETIRKMTEKYTEEKNTYKINPKLVSTLVLDSNNNDDPSCPILPIICFISITYFFFYFNKKYIF